MMVHILKGALELLSFIRIRGHSLTTLTRQGMYVQGRHGSQGCQGLVLAKFWQSP